MSETDKSLVAALVAFQADLTPVDKNSTNPFFKSKYADLTEVKTTVQPLLTKHKLAVTQWPTTQDGSPALRTRVMHESGEYDEDTMLLVLAKEDPQGQGSAITYAKRYAFMAALGIVADEDDDGNKASDNSTGYPQDAGTSPHGPTDKQISAIKGYLVQLGMDKDYRENVIAQTTTWQQASVLISQLKEKVANKRAAKVEG